MLYVLVLKVLILHCLFPHLVIITVVVVVGLTVILISRPKTIIGSASLGFFEIPIMLFLGFLFFSGLKVLSSFLLDLGQMTLDPHCVFYTVCLNDASRCFDLFHLRMVFVLFNTKLGLRFIIWVRVFRYCSSLIDPMTTLLG